MTDRVHFERDGKIAVITLDDGKVNAVSPALIAELNAALDQAEQDRLAVVITGRASIFSGGFDLKVMAAGGAPALGMVRGGFELALRLLTFERPVVTACNGHAIAMGAFLLLAGDYRLGVEGDFRLHANEVALGITVPRAAIEICRCRLAPSAFNRVVLLSKPVSPTEGVAVGFLDQLAPADTLLDTAKATARRLAGLDRQAFAETKLRAHAPAIAAIRQGIAADIEELSAGPLAR